MVSHQWFGLCPLEANNGISSKGVIEGDLDQDFSKIFAENFVYVVTVAQFFGYCCSVFW